MRTFDPTPLWRSTIGFDRLFDLLNASSQWTAFRWVFNLADYVQVRGASFTNGLLKIELVREVPEAMKPRRIAINTCKTDQQIEHKQAA
jgi:HSP20 family molecular chaperone IbpA